MVDEKTACIILSAGLSTRMGTHKALLPFSSGENFLQHIIKVYREAWVKKIAVVINPDINTAIIDGMDETVVVKNYSQQRGRLYSLYLGLKCFPGSDYFYVQNIDNPFVTAPLIHQLHESRMKADYITPVTNGHGGHPILVSSTVAQQILSLPSFDQSLRQILENHSRCRLPVEDGKVMADVNTPEEYETYFPKLNNHSHHDTKEDLHRYRCS
ncbi:MAG: NTP transferase domain-containing protein [Bacteroidetes bacterium]|nr:NTP transferase domain-containing protein [Bacteroidota bacterium]